LSFGADLTDPTTLAFISTQLDFCTLVGVFMYPLFCDNNWDTFACQLAGRASMHQRFLSKLNTALVYQGELQSKSCECTVHRYNDNDNTLLL
jgi:hypothetical protein